MCERARVRWLARGSRFAFGAASGDAHPRSGAGLARVLPTSGPLAVQSPRGSADTLCSRPARLPKGGLARVLWGLGLSRA